MCTSIWRYKNYDADDTEGLPITQGNNISLCLTFDQVEETKHVYDQLIEKAVRY